MATSEMSFFFLFPFLSFAHTAASSEPCSFNSSCLPTGPSVRFPFQIKHSQRAEDRRCRYPGFDLSCHNQSETTLNLPTLGDFTVSRIDYTAQNIWVNDPDNCLPKRLLQFTLMGSPFTGLYPTNYHFLNCSSKVSMALTVNISCLSGHKYTVLATPFEFVVGVLLQFYGCHEIVKVSVPGQFVVNYYNESNFPNLTEDLLLTWDTPSCRVCEEKGGVCRFKRDTGLEIECSNVPSHGLPMSAKYGVSFGIPGLVGLICLACYIRSRKTGQGPRRLPDMELSPSSVAPPPVVVTRGLDGPTLESYPKTVLGESPELPNPENKTCPICLSEYRPKETLRTISHCNHYFHAHCVDEWLRKNPTCPVCRISPEGLPLVTPFCSSSS